MQKPKRRKLVHRCTEPDCKALQYYKEGGVRGKCAYHGGSPRCTEPDCNTPQTYMKGGVRGKCPSHGGYPRCTEPECDTLQNYKEGGVRGKCASHGGYPRCTEPECDTSQHYKEGGVRGKCPKHGGCPKCVSCVLFIVTKEGKRCSYCRPQSAKAKRAKKEEEAVAAVLKADGMIFERERHISYECITSDDKKFAKLDFLIERPDKRVILEVDERQHKNVAYDIKCDLSRMTYVMAAIACTDNVRPTLWIRFNPNGYSVDGYPMRTRKKAKYAKLLSVIKDTKPLDGTQVIYMYYDTERGLPVICKDSTYSARMKAMLGPSIV